MAFIKTHVHIHTHPHTQIYMPYRMFCSIILMSINVAQNKSKPFSRLSLTITWPSPCTHQPSTDTHTHTRRLLYNKAITIKAVSAGVLSNIAQKLHLTHPA